MIEQTEIWFVIVALGIGSFLLRFLFLGFIGDRPMPPWLLRHLRYTAVTVLPALVAPLVVWPAANGGETDPMRVLAAAATLFIGFWTKNVIAAMGSGAAVLLIAHYLP
ncbi:MAG: AzlD domain-containing protein [Pelagimonas sp.]